VTTLDTNQSPIARSQSIAASVQKLSDSVVVSQSAQIAMDSRCVRRNDQVID